MIFLKKSQREFGQAIKSRGARGGERRIREMVHCRKEAHRANYLQKAQMSIDPGKGAG